MATTQQVNEVKQIADTIVNAEAALTFLESDSFITLHLPESGYLHTGPVRDAIESAISDAKLSLENAITAIKDDYEDQLENVTINIPQQ